MMVRLNEFGLFKVLGLAILFFAQAACGQRKPAPEATGDYDLSHPQKFNMPESLLEISGITFRHGSADTIYAEQDEKGRLYRFHPGDRKIEYTAFGKDGDYEDLAILKDQVFMLRSDGVLFSFSLHDSSPDGAENVREYKKLVPKGEYEGLYADEREKKLYLLCKNCKEKGISGYILNWTPDGELSPDTSFSIDLTAVRGAGIKKKASFRPSAIARHPSSGEWYILSSVNKVLLITDPQFKVKYSFNLNSGLFLQPEGIAFDKDLNLYISNEGDEISAGNILKFKPLK